MARRFPSLVFCCLALVAFLAMSAAAADKPAERPLSPAAKAKTLTYAFPDAQFKYLTRPGKDVQVEQQALGSFSPAVSPGVDIGDTYYEYQRNGSMRRMITTGTHGTPDTLLVHFSWMYLPGVDITTAREYRYDVFNAAAGVFGTETGLQADEEYAGYCGVSTTGDNRAVVGGHNNLTPPSGPYHPQFYWDFAPANSFFNTNSRIPDSTSLHCQAIVETPAGTGHIWPAFEYVESPSGGVLHVIAQESNTNAGDPQSIAYFRKVGDGASGVWDYPPYCIDTIHDLSHDLDATDEGLLVLAWTANLPDTSDPCGGGDTCSSDGNTGMVAANQWNNDVYIQKSTDYGVSFLPRVNVTKYQFLQPGFRAYTDLSVLIDSRDVVHVVFNTSEWLGNNPTSLFFRGRFFHWDDQTNSIVTCVNYQWDQDECNGGAWMLNAAKMTISECNGMMYVLFTQYNRYDETTNTVISDCAAETSPGYPGGAANGELYITVSDDWGSTWDRPRDITNSASPGCDSVGGTNGPCESDTWSSMTRFGTNYSGIFPPTAIIDETDIGGNANEHAGWYLDAQFMRDVSAGGIVQDEGYWQNSDVHWIRIPCVLPILEALLFVTPTDIDYPTWTKHGVQLDTAGQLEGGGNDGLSYVLSTVTTTGPPGAIGVTGGDGSLVPNEIDPITIQLNVGGAVNSPGTVVYVAGELRINWQGNSGNPGPTLYTVPIEFWVTDTLYLPEWDTVSTACTRLAVANHGEWGGGTGADSANLDYMALGNDCTGDNDPDTLSDNAEVYVYDGSPYICLQEGSDTACFYSVFNNPVTDTTALLPYGQRSKADSGGAEVFRSGTFVTADTNVAFQKIWYAPKNDAQNCSFMVQCIKIWLENETAILNDVRIGEIMDWDIPADTGARNYTGFDGGLNLIYQQGSEEDGEGCQPNDTRWGGISFLDKYVNGVRTGPFGAQSPHGAYTKDNQTQVFPLGTFNEDSLFLYTAFSGYASSDTVNTDLHTVMTFDSLPALVDGDTLVYYVLVASHHNGTLQDFKDEVIAGRAWYCANISPEDCGCCNTDAMRGDADNDCTFGCVTVSDLSFLVSYLFQNGPAPVCCDEANADGDCTFGCITVSDLSYLVSFLFQNGPNPLGCSEGDLCP